MAAIERVVAVDGLAGLLARGQPRVEDPAVALALGAPGQLAVDVDRREERERARAVHDDAEVVVAQLGRGDRGEVRPERGQRERLGEEGRGRSRRGSSSPGRSRSPRPAPAPRPPDAHGDLDRHRDRDLAARLGHGHDRLRGRHDGRRRRRLGRARLHAAGREDLVGERALLGRERLLLDELDDPADPHALVEEAAELAVLRRRHARVVQRDGLPLVVEHQRARRSRARCRPSSAGSARGCRRSGSRAARSASSRRAGAARS